MDSYGVPAGRLRDEELRQLLGDAHATREWALRRGTDEQFQRHTLRTLELQHEFLRRQLWRQALQWRAVVDEATRLSNSLRDLIVRLESGLGDHPGQLAPGLPASPATPVAAAAEPILAWASWAPDMREYRAEEPDGGLEDRPDGIEEDKEPPAHVVDLVPSGSDVASSNWQGWWARARRPASA